MRTPFTSRWLATALGVWALGALDARAAPDTFGLGSGRNGPLTVGSAGVILNAYAPVTEALPRAATSIAVGACVGDPCFRAEDLILVYQATGLTPVPGSGAAGPFDLSASSVGRWELARLKSVSVVGANARLELTEPLVRDFAANVTQVIRVPEYTSVSIAAGSSITASPWNGSTGGVVAFLAQNEVNNQGRITVEGLGFRGGRYVADTSGLSACSELDEVAKSGAQKGEGLGGVAFYGETRTGRGNVANGAGGAVCVQSGGGGGGNAGPGGQGGQSADGARPKGGLGGAALSLPVLTQLTFGGGGGAGHGAFDGGGLSGGAGGGVVFLRALQLSGSGAINASGGGVNTATEGGSGGGAGGSIYARIVRSAVCGAVSVNGGIGGTSSSARVGPGGGGGAGQLLFQAATGGSCTVASKSILAKGAASGGQLIPAEGAYGAQAGLDAAPVEKTYGFILPMPPAVTTPAQGLITKNVRPRITGTARIYTEATSGTEVILFLDGVELSRVPLDDKGVYTYELKQDLEEREHRVEAALVVDAAQSPNGTLNTFRVDITPPRPTIAGPSGAIRERDPRFAFGADEEVVQYTCSLDGADFVPCPADGVFPGLADGSHSVRVRAEDLAGNVSEPTTQAFRVTVADIALFGDGVVGCSAVGAGPSFLLGCLGALSLGLRRRRGATR